MLDPASSVEMVKVLEEDPMVGGVGGDVQVTCEFWDICHIFCSELVIKFKLSFVKTSSYPFVH